MTKEQRKDIALFVVAHPELPYKDIAAAKRLGISTITKLCVEFGIRRPRGKKDEYTIAATPTALPEVQ
jgi:hypothetical protein